MHTTYNYNHLPVSIVCNEQPKSGTQAKCGCPMSKLKIKIPLEFEQQQPTRHISVEAMNVSILEYLNADHWTCFNSRKPLQGNTDMDGPAHDHFICYVMLSCAIKTPANHVLYSSNPVQLMHLPYPIYEAQLF